MQCNRNNAVKQFSTRFEMGSHLLDTTSRISRMSKELALDPVVLNSPQAPEDCPRRCEGHPTWFSQSSVEGLLSLWNLLRSPPERRGPDGGVWELASTTEKRTAVRKTNYYCEEAGLRWPWPPARFDHTSRQLSRQASPHTKLSTLWTERKRVSKGT